MTLRAADLFSGAGGSCAGLREHFRVVFANEVNEYAAKVYGLNRADHTELDIRSVNGLDERGQRVNDPVTGQDILQAVRADGGERLDLLTASPPCQSVSRAGKQLGAHDPRGIGLLAAEPGRVGGEAGTLAVVTENVDAWVEPKMRGHFEWHRAAIEDAGYRTSWMVLDAADFGVPQGRRRVITLGFRAELGLDPESGSPNRPSVGR